MTLDDLHFEGLELFPPDALPADEFIARLRAGMLVASGDRLLRDWNYAPWFSGSFTHAGQSVDVTVYLGGLGKLTSGSACTHFLLATP